MKYYWIMKNGEKIDVDEMSEEHLRNTLKMLLRKGLLSNTKIDFKRNHIDSYYDDEFWRRYGNKIII